MRKPTHIWHVINERVTNQQNWWGTKKTKKMYNRGTKIVVLKIGGLKSQLS